MCVDKNLITPLRPLQSGCHFLEAFLLAQETRFAKCCFNRQKRSDTETETERARMKAEAA